MSRIILKIYVKKWQQEEKKTRAAPSNDFHARFPVCKQKARDYTCKQSLCSAAVAIIVVFGSPSRNNIYIKFIFIRYISKKNSTNINI